MSIPEERLMAYADGELSDAEHADERAQIEAAMKADASVAIRVEKHRALRRQMGGAFSAVLNEPVPDRLLAAARTAPASSASSATKVTDLGSVRAARSAEAAAGAERRRAAWGWTQWGAMAASLVLGAIIGHVAMRSPEAGLITNQNGKLVAQAGLDQALSTQLTSGQAASAPVHIGVSFKAKDGKFCRTFVVQQGEPLSGLACREGSAWDVHTLARTEAPTSGDGGYQQAGSALPAAVRAAVEDQIEGDPFDAAAEAQAQANGWQ